MYVHRFNFDRSFRETRVIEPSQGHALNNNPTINDVLSGGASFTSMPTAVTTLTPSVPASASESYTYEDTSGAIVNAQENPLLSWHANAGDFLYVRSDSVGSNQFTPGKTAPTTGNNTFVFVLRDGRGGEAVLQRDF